MRPEDAEAAAQIEAENVFPARGKCPDFLEAVESANAVYFCGRT